MANSSTTVEDTANKYKHRVNRWKVAEDEKLRQLVQEHGPHGWKSIAEHLEGKTEKSCRSRWCKYLDPRLNKNPFTKEEEDRLLAAHTLYGPRWSSIVKFFHGRTDTALMNHWHVLMTRQRRESKKRCLQESVNGSSTSSSSNNPANFYTKQSLLASMYPNGSLKFGSIPSFSEAFPGVDSIGKEGSDHFELFNGAGDGKVKSSLFDNSLTELRASSSSAKEHADDGRCKEVPFYDFLGVNGDDQ